VVEDVFQMMARAIGTRSRHRRVIVILDELPYALQQDKGFASHIRHYCITIAIQAAQAGGLGSPFQG